jgi:hypothetical protein
MVGINAQRVVAAMQDMLASWDHSVTQDPTKAMGSHHFPTIQAGSDRELPIPFGAGSRASPNPASRRFVNLGEKPVFDIHVISFRRQDLKEKGYQRLVIRQQNGP